MLTLVSVARYDLIKDHETLFGAVAEALRLGADVRLVCAGRDTDSLKFRSAAQRYGISDRVTGLGSRADIMNVYAMGSIFVLSSTAENSPIVVAEALAAGLYVVSTDVGDVRETIGDCGTVVPARDPAALGGAIADAAWSTADRDHARRHGPDRVRASFDPDAFVAAWSALLTPKEPRQSWLKRPLEWARWNLRLAVPPLKIWIMAAVAWTLSWVVIHIVAPLVPITAVRAQVEWAGIVLHFFALFGLLGHVYNQLVGGFVDKTLELWRSS